VPPIAPVSRVDVELAFRASFDPAAVGEATGADEYVRLPLYNANLDILVARRRRDQMPTVHKQAIDIKLAKPGIDLDQGQRRWRSWPPEWQASGRSRGLRC
jgi:hypothetical protein